MAEEMVMDEVATPEVDEAPAESTDIGEETEGDSAEQEEQGAEDEAEGEESESDEEEPVEDKPADGRKMPDGLKKAIASLKTTSPEVAKQIKGIYYAEQEYRAAFPKPEDAVAAKNLIEEIGGQEGIQEIAAEREEWRKIDSDFSEGKPDFVKSLAEGNPEAFLKTAPHVINEFATRAPEQYAYYANRLTLNTMASSGFSLQNLHGAYERYKESNPEAAGIIAEVYNAMYDLNSKAAQFEQKRTDPREEQLKQREQEFETKRRADFETGVASQAEKYLGEKMTPEIDRIIGNRKVDPEAMKEFQKMVQGKVGELLAAIPGIEDKLEAYYRTGDSAKSVAYIQSQYNRLLPQAVKVIEPFLRNIAAAPAKTQQRQVNGKAEAAEPGTVVLKEMPEWHQVDQSKTSVADLIEGRAVLKNGKKATGWA